MTKYRVRVQGPSATGRFGGDWHWIESPSCVTDKDGLLIVQAPPFPGTPAHRGMPARKATGPSQIIYPRGGWTKVTITELLEEVA